MATSSVASSGPSCLAPVREGIPAELKERDQWLVHRDGAPHAARGHNGHQDAARDTPEPPASPSHWAAPRSAPPGRGSSSCAIPT
jgi:hypothetical protein